MSSTAAVYDLWNARKAGLPKVERLKIGETENLAEQSPLPDRIR